MLETADSKAACAFADALGIKDIPYDEINFKVDASNRDRKDKCLPPLI